MSQNKPTSSPATRVERQVAKWRDELLDLWRRAERSGFDLALNVDHFQSDWEGDAGPTLEAWALELTAQGIGHPGVVDELGKPSLVLRDPDGNAIELVAPPGTG